MKASPSVQEAEERMRRAEGRWDAMLRAVRATIGEVVDGFSWDPPEDGFVKWDDPPSDAPSRHDHRTRSPWWHRMMGRGP